MHIVWTTRDRVPLIDAVAAEQISELLGPIATQQRTTLLATGIVSTHVHLLVRTHPVTSVPDLVQRFKAISALLINRQRARQLPLKWAKGYSISSVGERSLGAAHRYVCRQHTHHPGEAIPGWPRVERTGTNPSLK